MADEKKDQKLDPKKVYTVVGTGKHKFLPKGYEAIIGGGDAAILIEKGAITVKAEA